MQEHASPPGIKGEFDQHQKITMTNWSQLVVSVTFTLIAFAPVQEVLAQPSCTVEGLTREDQSQIRLAVRVNQEWHRFAENPNGPAHILKKGTLKKLCLAWEAPPHPGHHAQIVYASTQYRADQPLYLWRNSTVASLPYVGKLLSSWNRQPVVTAGEKPDITFREYHRTLPNDPYNSPWKNLTDWHDTSLWRANVKSYDLVVSVVTNSPSIPHGTERLLLLSPRRPLTSWVSFTTHAPLEQNNLRVAVSYSGDLEFDGAYVYEYNFQVR